MVLKRDLRAALERLDPDLPPAAIGEAVGKLTRHDFSRSLLQHNREFYRFIRDGVPVSYRDARGELRQPRARVIDFRNGTTNGRPSNRFRAVRELKITGLRAPSYNRRADLVCFVNGLPLVFIELKAVYKNIRAGFDGNLREPYSTRDDIVVISDEAHRTQAGKLARNMRLALPNAAFIGFTGTPLFKDDHLTKRIFGNYVSRYDFKRSEQDGATVKLVYENRGEKLGIARLDLNDRIAEAIDRADLDPDKEALLERLLGQDYEVITADDRLDKVAADFVEHCATRWESGKAMLICIDKLTCARMLQRILPRWQAKLSEVRGLIPRRMRSKRFPSGSMSTSGSRARAGCSRLPLHSSWPSKGSAQRPPWTSAPG